MPAVRRAVRRAAAAAAAAILARRTATVGSGTVGAVRAAEAAALRVRPLATRGAQKRVATEAAELLRLERAVPASSTAAPAERLACDESAAAARCCELSSTRSSPAGMVLLGAIASCFETAARRAILASAAFFFDASCCLGRGGPFAARGRKLKFHSVAAMLRSVALNERPQISTLRLRTCMCMRTSLRMHNDQVSKYFEAATPGRPRFRKLWQR